MNKIKNGIRMLLVFLMMLSMTAVYAETPQNITVYVSISQYGDLVEGKNEETMANIPVHLTDKKVYHLDDLFREVHSLYYPSAEDGYASSESEWGFGIDMLWGNTSGNFGYQVNGGTESVMGLGHILKDGDYVDACIYQNLYPDTEGYAVFDKREETVVSGEAVSFMLTSVSGYDESWNTIFSPCSEAVITVNGEKTDVMTDEAGMATIYTEKPGTYIISAKKEKVLQEKSVPAITAPVLILNVREHPAIRVLHGIAQTYTETDLESLGGNLPWVLADMAVYENLFPQSGIALSEAQKDEAIHILVPFIKEAEKPGDMAKYILALRALGYDAENIYTEDFEKTNIVEKLLLLIEKKDESVTNIYTLPYVLTALLQGEEYAEEEHFQYLIDAALSKKEIWQDVSQGTDALCPMITALAPFGSESEEISDVLAESLEILKAEQREDGLIDGFEGYEPASTGLAICSVSAMGENAAKVKNTDNSLIDGLLSAVNEENNRFPNAFATEQGFRGLLSWVNLLNTEKKYIYDFKSYPKEQLNVSGIKYCPVIFEVSPEKATIWVEGYEEIAENTYDLPMGEHKYRISASGYKEENGTIKINEKAEKEHIVKTVSVALSRKSSGGGSSGGSSSHKPEKEETQPPKQEPSLQEPTEKTEKELFTDVNENDWFYDAVYYVQEKGLFQGTDRGFEPNGNMTRGMVATVLFRMDSDTKKAENAIFSDVATNEWYTDGISWCVAKNIMQGIGNGFFAPDQPITREQLATVLYRYAQYKNAETVDASIINYKDADRISPYAKDAFVFTVHKGIISGKENDMLAPQDYATRAEVAMMLMRFAKVVK